MKQSIEKDNKMDEDIAKPIRRTRIRSKADTLRPLQTERTKGRTADTGESGADTVAYLSIEPGPLRKMGPSHGKTR